MNAAKIYYWVYKMILVKNLSKDYGDIKALDNINFGISKGEMVALLGPNGAGKTTLMRLLTGYLQPSSGEISIMGMNFCSQPAKILQQIGYVPENGPLYGDMTVYEFLRFMGELRGLKKEQLDEKISSLFSQFELKEVASQKIDTLSKGFKRRVSIAGSLIGEPPILILDEPTEGLDPNQKFTVRQFLKDYSKNNIVIISTHILEEVSALASRVLLLNHGKLIQDTTTAKLSLLAPDNNLETAFRNITNKG